VRGVPCRPPIHLRPQERNRLCIRRYVYKRHRLEFKRLFKSILFQYQGASATFVPMCHVGNTAIGTRTLHGGHRLRASAGVLFSQSKFTHFRRRTGAAANVAMPRQRAITSHISPYYEHSAKFYQCKFQLLPNTKYLVQTD
jgi:hypothetical protein